MNYPVRVFTLAKRAPGARGLVCDGEGVMLGPAPLVVPAQDVAGRTIFRAVRPRRVADVLAAAYGSGFDAALGRHLAQLDGIAKALSEGKLAEAAIRAVHMQLPELTAEGARRLARLGKYSPDQPRVPASEPGGGQWTSEGGGGGDQPVRVAANDTGVMSDAGDPGMRVAAESESESGRGGRGFLEDEFLDQTAEARAAWFNASMARLRAIDPANPQAAYVASPGWVPKPEDLRQVGEALQTAIEDAAAKIAEHSYDEHVIARREFPEVGSQLELQIFAQNVIRTARPEEIPSGQTIFYEAKTNTLVVINPGREWTIFRPTQGAAYVERLRRGR